MTLIGSYKKTIHVLRHSKTLAISGHINPDGDSLGSLLALGLALKKIKKNIEFATSFIVRFVNLCTASIREILEFLTHRL